MIWAFDVNGLNPVPFGSVPGSAGLQHASFTWNIHNELVSATAAGRAASAASRTSTPSAYWIAGGLKIDGHPNTAH